MKFSRDHITFISIIVGIVLGILVMSSFNSGLSNFEDAALGKATKPHYIVDKQGNDLHYSPKNDPEKFIKGVTPYLNNKTVLYLGNSQSHSINQKKDGDNTMSGYLFNELKDSNITFLTASIPNANLQEHYLLFNYFTAKLPNLKLVVIPIFMDDLRETGIRESYFKSFSNSDFLIPEENKLAIEINNNLSSFKQSKNIDTTQTNNADFNALDNTTQNIVERKLNNYLKSNFSFWKNRESIRGQYFTTLYKTRNSVLNISSQTTRKMIPSRYNKNLNALDLMLEKAKKQDVKVILMIPPLRKDITYPYDVNEYETFKVKVKNIAASNSVSFIDVDNIVEGKYWGYSAPTQLFKETDYDFMHFQSGAHRIMADTLKPYILKEVL